MTEEAWAASAPPPGRRSPLYARVLRLRRLRLSGMASFLLFEGMIALAVLLALAELVSWWAVLALPAAVALMVKFNDLVADALAGRAGPAGSPGVGTSPPTGAAPMDPADLKGPGEPVGPAPTDPEPGAAEPGRQVSRDLVNLLDPVDSPRQRFRQSAQRRYE